MTAAADGAARFAIGADLTPRGSRGAYDAKAGRDLAAMAASSATLVRLFASWPAMEPQVGRYDDDALVALARTVAQAGDLGMRVIVCLFADLGTGDLLDVSWGGRRQPGDPYMVERAAGLAGRVALALADEHAMAGWQLGDLAFLSRFDSSDALERWAAAVGDAVRERDPVRPIALGADLETLFQSSGVDAAASADRFSLAVAQRTPTIDARLAPGPGLAGPVTYLTGFLVRLARTGLPVLAEGVGPATADLGVDEGAGLLRLSLYSTLVDRAGAALAGRWRAPAGPERVPMHVSAGERLTGITDPCGTAGAAAHVFSEFARTVAALDAESATLAPEAVAVFLPSDRRNPTPASAARALRTTLTAFALAKEAHLPVDVRREVDGFEGLAVAIVPSPRTIQPATWRALAEFSQAGGTAVISHGGGEPDPMLRSLAGVEYLGPTGPRATVACRVAQPGSLGAAESFDAELPVAEGALLGLGGATVLAVDANGRPLVTVHRHGQGRIYHLALPLEAALAALPHDETPAAVAGLVRGLYRAAAEHAGATGPADCDRPRVETAVLTGENGRVLLALNHAPTSVVARITWERRVAAVAPLGGTPTETPVGGTSFRLPLGPHGVLALRIRTA